MNNQAQREWKRLYRLHQFTESPGLEMLRLRYPAALERALAAANRRAERANISPETAKSIQASISDPFDQGEIEGALDILENLLEKCNLGEIDQHAAPALGIAIDILCKVAGIEVKA